MKDRIKWIMFPVFFSTLLLPVCLPAQRGNDAGSFTFVKSTAVGDLNKDNLPDSVVVLQDTIHEKQPYRLKIFFAQPGKTYKLVLQNDSAIESKYPSGREGFNNGTDFYGVTIRSGVLTLETELVRGHYAHKFRFQGGNFELIGFSQTYSDGQGIMTTTEFNLSTGVLVEMSERYDTGKLLSKKRTKKLIRPLPKLKTFKPFSTTLF